MTGERSNTIGLSVRDVILCELAKLSSIMQHTSVEVGLLWNLWMDRLDQRKSKTFLRAIFECKFGEEVLIEWGTFVVGGRHKKTFRKVVL